MFYFNLIRMIYDEKDLQILPIMEGVLFKLDWLFDIRCYSVYTYYVLWEGACCGVGGYAFIKILEI